MKGAIQKADFSTRSQVMTRCRANWITLATSVTTGFLLGAGMVALIWSIS